MHWEAGRSVKLMAVRLSKTGKASPKATLYALLEKNNPVNILSKTVNKYIYGVPISSKTPGASSIASGA